MQTALTFKSKVDKKLLLPVVVICGILMMLSLAEFLWPLMIVSVGLFAFVYLIFHRIRYHINGYEMTITTLGIRNYKFDIRNIKTITETNNPMSSPAASLDRLDLRISKLGSVLVSPEDKEDFIKLLLSINPEIQVKRQLKKTF